MSEFKDLKGMIRAARENPAAPQKLNEAQQRSLLKLVTERCRHDTKRAVAINIDRPFKEWPGRWAIERLQFYGDRADFCVGQDYNNDMRELRKQLVFFN